MEKSKGKERREDWRKKRERCHRKMRKIGDFSF